MKKNLRLLSSALVLLLLCTLSISALAADTAGHTYESSIQRMRDLSVLEGRADGNFYPEDTLNRAEAAKVAAMLLGYTYVDATDAVNDDTFKDVHSGMSAHRWARGWINLVAAEGVILGDGTGNYNPGGTLTMREWGTILIRVLGYSTADLAWPQGYDEKIKELNLDIETTYNGAAGITRAQMARFADTAVYNIQRQEGSTIAAVVFGEETKNKFEIIGFE